MNSGNALTAGVAVLVFLLTIVVLWAEQEWWYMVPAIGFIILVPLVFVLIGEY